MYCQLFAATNRIEFVNFTRSFFTFLYRTSNLFDFIDLVEISLARNLKLIYFVGVNPFIHHFYDAFAQIFASKVFPDQTFWENNPFIDAAD